MKRAAIALALLLAPASARAQASPAERPALPAAPEPEEPHGFSAKLWAGPSYRRIYSIPIYGGGMGLALGGQRGHVAGYGGADVTLGRTDFGLHSTEVHLRGEVEGRWGPWRAGVGGGFAYLAIDRLTSASAMQGYGVEVRLLGSVDLFPIDTGHALYLGGELGTDLLFPWSSDLGTHVTAVWGPRLNLGVRY